MRTYSFVKRFMKNNQHSWNREVCQVIRICKLEEGIDITYDYVRCPSCGKGRLCDKPRGTKVAVLRIEGTALDHVVVKCPKCSALYLVTAEQ